MVTLEPCCHTEKRTPPCVDAVIKAGIKKVVVAMFDPNPEVNGKGIETLRKAGIDVKVGVLSEEARRLNEVFVTFQEKKRPFFIMKSAVSLDGKIATKIGESKWISNEESRAYVSRLRSVMDAILVGINTVILDNPLLLPKVARPKRYPARIVLDSKLRIPLSCELVKTASTYRTIVFTLPDQSVREGGPPRVARGRGGPGRCGENGCLPPGRLRRAAEEGDHERPRRGWGRGEQRSFKEG